MTQIVCYVAQLMQLEARKRSGVITSRNPLHTCKTYTVLDASHDWQLGEAWTGGDDISDPYALHAQAAMKANFISRC